MGGRDRVIVTSGAIDKVREFFGASDSTARIIKRLDFRMVSDRSSVLNPSSTSHSMAASVPGLTQT